MAESRHWLPNSHYFNGSIQCFVVSQSLYWTPNPPLSPHRESQRFLKQFSLSINYLEYRKVACYSNIEYTVLRHTAVNTARQNKQAQLMKFNQTVKWCLILNEMPLNFKLSTISAEKKYKCIERERERHIWPEKDWETMRKKSSSNQFLSRRTFGKQEMA